jgi:hypothetical protein
MINTFLRAALSVPPGTSWSQSTSATTSALRDVTWGNSLFVAVGSSGVIRTSPDGITWTSRTSGTTNTLYGVTWDGFQFVAVGSGGVILTSPNGTTWTARTSGTTIALLSVASSGNLLLAGGYDLFDYVVCTSTDGITWTVVTTGDMFTSPRYPIASVIWAGDKFYTVGGSLNSVRTTVDGITWQSYTSAAIEYAPQDIAWSGTQFLLVTTNGGLVISGDGVNWTRTRSGGGAADNKFGAGYAAQLAVAVGESGRISTSPDGTTWTNRTSGVSTVLNSVAWSGSRLVVVGASGVILVSQ